MKKSENNYTQIIEICISHFLNANRLIDNEILMEFPKPRASRSIKFWISHDLIEIVRMHTVCAWRKKWVSLSEGGVWVTFHYFFYIFGPSHPNKIILFSYWSLVKLRNIKCTYFISFAVSPLLFVTHQNYLYIL